MKIVFLGNNWLGLKVAEYLSKEKEKIVSLVLNPPNKRRYGSEIRDCVNVDDKYIFESQDLSDTSKLKLLTDLKPDLALSVLCSSILKPQFIHMFPLGVINLHPSYLPYNRGAYPNVWSIVEGTPAGATMHFIDAGVDTGDIIAQTQVPVEVTDTGKSLYEKLEKQSLDLFINTWPKLKAGAFERIKQGRNDGSFHYIKDILNIDEIDMGKRYSAQELIDVIRARTFPPYPGAYFMHNGKRIYLRMELIPEDRLER